MTREEAIDILQNTSFFGRTMDDIDTAIDMAIKALEQEPKTWHWIYCYTNGFGRKICKCSKCNWDGDTTGYKYCPNCGVKMQ